MKKLMIAAAIACAAVVSQAATMKWAVSGVEAKDTATTEDYYMVCFMSADTTGAAASKLTTLAAAEAWAKSLGESGSVNILKEANLDDEGNASTTKFSTYDSQWIDPGKGDFYAVIFNADDIANATAYMITTVTKVPYAGLGDSLTANVGAGEWQSVPEPTSGLLLLIGVAGLALKRKRA